MFNVLVCDIITFYQIYISILFVKIVILTVQDIECTYISCGMVEMCDNLGNNVLYIPHHVGV